MTYKRSILSAMATLAFADCDSQQPGLINDFNPVASARLTGTVVSTNGQLLDSARVSLVLPGEYAVAFAYTDARGQFAVNAYRIGEVTPPAYPDTLRVDVLVEWIKGKRADGKYPQLKTPQLLTFAPANPAPSVVALRVPVP